MALLCTPSEKVPGDQILATCCRATQNTAPSRGLVLVGNDCRKESLPRAFTSHLDSGAGASEWLVPKRDVSSPDRNSAQEDIPWR